ncbi:MAG TPA: L,D-transpeptidase family protein [Anaerolineales bacterium]|nr:L,D-transpeptidase family protein [Anaerolineales bacterium]
MDHQFIEARELIAKAREALRRGDRPSARQLGEQAALRAPDMEDAWLVLAASDPDPQEALAYARKALQLNPQSERAHRGVEWASSRLKQASPQREPRRAASKEQSPGPRKIVPNQVEGVTGLPQKRAYQTAIALPQLKSNGPNWLLPALLAGAGFMLVAFIAFFALTSPALASYVNRISAPPPAAQEKLWAPAEIAKPGVTPIDSSAFAVQPGDTATSAPTEVASTAASTEAAVAPSRSPTLTYVPTEAPTATPAITETPGSMAMEVLADTPTSAYVAPTYTAPKNPVAGSGNGARWIDVDLTNQMVYAYEGDTVVNSFVVSTGTWIHPTVTGKYAIYIRLRSGSMSGPGYFLPNVPYIMYFYKSYGLHGTYWHNNFGTPMSHGCVNLRTDDAAWLYNWSSLGTVVNVHY